MKDSKGGQYGFAVLPSSTGELLLEVESDLSRKRTRRYVVRSAERGKEVVESVLVGDVDRRKLETYLVLVSAEDVVMSDRNVEKTSARDPGWVLVVVLGIRLRHLQKRRSELPDGTNQ